MHVTSFDVMQHRHGSVLLWFAAGPFVHIWTKSVFILLHGMKTWQKWHHLKHFIRLHSAPCGATEGFVLLLLRMQRYSSGHANRHKCLPSSVAVWDQLYFETVMKMNSDWSQRELTRGDKLAADAKEQRGVVFAGGRQNHVVTDEITEQMFMCVLRRLYAESSGITF